MAWKTVAQQQQRREEEQRKKREQEKKNERNAKFLNSNAMRFSMSMCQNVCTLQIHEITSAGGIKEKEKQTRRIECVSLAQTSFQELVNLIDEPFFPHEMQ